MAEGMIDLTTAMLRIEFPTGQSALGQVPVYPFKERFRPLILVFGFFSREVRMQTVIRHQSIIRALGKIPCPFSFDLTGSYKVEAEHAPHCGMTECGDIVYEQSRFGSVKNRIIGARHGVSSIIGLQQELGRSERLHCALPFPNGGISIHRTGTPSRSTASL